MFVPCGLCLVLDVEYRDSVVSLPPNVASPGGPPCPPPPAHPLPLLQLYEALGLVRQLLPESLIGAFLAYGKGLGPGVPSIEHYISVVVVYSPGGASNMCFLCGGAASKSNPVNVGDLSLARACWGVEGARAAYERRWVARHPNLTPVA